MTVRYFYINIKLISFVCIAILFATTSNADQTISEFIGPLGSSLGVPNLYLGMTKPEFDIVMKNRNIDGVEQDEKRRKETTSFSFKGFYKEQIVEYKFYFRNGLLTENHIAFEHSGLDYLILNDEERITRTMCIDAWKDLTSNAIKFYGHPSKPEKTTTDLEVSTELENEVFCSKFKCIPSKDNFTRITHAEFQSNNHILRLHKNYIDYKYWIYDRKNIRHEFINHSCSISITKTYIPSDITLSDAYFVRNSNSNQPLPMSLVDETQRYTPPALINLETLQTCQNEADNDAYNFVDCVSENSLTGVQKKAYLCSKDYAQSKDKKALGLCLLKANMGQNEQKAADIAMACYNEHGSNINKYPKCITEQVSDEKTARAIGCVQEQAKSSDFSYWGLAACYGAGELKMNPEATVAVECAMSSGGEPITFMSCAGGRLTAMELQKCIDDGIGDGGCLGENNELVKLRDKILEPYGWVGEQLNDALGEGNEISKNWNNAVNDISNGPGENNDAIKMIGNAANDFNNGPGKNNDLKKIADKIDEIIPGFKF